MQIGHTLQLSIMSPLRLAHPMAELYSNPVSKQRKTIYFDDLLMTIAHHEKRCFFLGMLFLFPQRPTKGSVWWKQSSGLGATFSIFFFVALWLKCMNCSGGKKQSIYVATLGEKNSNHRRKTFSDLRPAGSLQKQGGHTRKKSTRCKTIRP